MSRPVARAKLLGGLVESGESGEHGGLAARQQKPDGGHQHNDDSDAQHAEHKHGGECKQRHFDNTPEDAGHQIRYQLHVGILPRTQKTTQFLVGIVVGIGVLKQGAIEPTYTIELAKPANHSIH